jgi:hypothetical protein
MMKDNNAIAHREAANARSGSGNYSRCFVTEDPRGSQQIVLNLF